MHNLVPAFITTELLRGNREGHFPAVGLFVDLTGYSTITTALMSLGQQGAETLAELMRDLFDPMITCVYENGGLITTFSGDSFTALFPIEEGSSDAPHSAMHCAIHIQEQITRKKIQQTPVGEFNISVRVGISAGEASWGIIISEDHNRAAYYFRGTAIEGCIQSQLAAADGEIILDRDAASMLDEVIKAEPVDEHYRFVEALAEIPSRTLPIEEAPDPETSAYFFPQSILYQGQSGEFRHIVNMFISLPTVRTEPQLEIFMRALFELQNRYGGLLNRLDFGDKGSHLLLFWGAPVTYENDIGRALNFILALQTETSIPIKAGITYRISHAGFIGNHIREEYTCYGEGVNLAARFMTEAGRGEVWIDEQIAKRVSHYFDLELEGEQEFKGFDEPQKVYSLFERRQNIRTFFKGKFLGRSRELNEIRAHFDQFLAKRSAVPLVIIGVPGIGKSRLVNHFRENLSAEYPEFLWARCQTDQVLRESFNPLRYWLKRYFEISDTQAESRNKRNFNRNLDRLVAATPNRQLAAELDRTRSFIGSLVDLFWDDSLFEQLDPESKFENTLIGLTSLLQANSLQQPVVLYLEDVQWLDQASKAFLNQLHRTLETADGQPYPILILATSRDYCAENCLGEQIPNEELVVEPLMPAEIVEMAKETLGGPVAESLSIALIEATEGNPFFAEQILLYLQENHQLAQTDQGWDLAQADKTFLPEDLRTLLVARLDQTDLEVKQIVQMAAILGREFDTGLLSQIVGQEKDITPQLARAEEAMIWTAVGATRYVFQNNLLRDAAYQMQTLSLRQRLHARAVSALEDLYQDNLSRVYAELAHHSQRANLIDKAVQYLYGAGKTAAENYHNQLAIDYFTRAIVLSPDTRDRQYFNLLIEREKVFGLLGQREDQINDLRLADRVAKTLGSPELIARTKNELADYYGKIGDYDNAIAIAREAIEIAQEHGLTEIQAAAHNTWANCARHHGQYEISRQQSLLGIQLSNQIDNLFGVCMGLSVLALTASDQGDYAEAAEYLQQNLETAKKTGDLNLQAQAMNNLGNVYGDLGDLSTAYEFYVLGLDLARKKGNRMGEGLVNTNLGWVTGLLGDYQTARQHLEESIRIAKVIGDIYNHAYSLVNMSLISTSLGDHQRAEENVRAALQLLAEAGHKPGMAIGWTYLGHVYLAENKLEDARESYTTALSLREELGQENLAMEPLAGLAEVIRRTAGAQQAMAQVDRILAYLEANGSLAGIDQPFRVYSTCGRIMEEVDHPETRRFIQNAYDTLQKQAANIKDPKWRDSFLNNVACHQEMIRLYQRNIQQSQ